MPRSRRFRKSQNPVKEWGKNNPQNKVKKRKMLIAIGIIAVIAVAISAFVVLAPSIFPKPAPYTIYSPAAIILTSPAGEYSSTGTKVLLMVKGTDSSNRDFNGNITIQLRDDKPLTSSNFANLVRQGLYDGTSFHRVISSFMIQGGQITSRVVSPINDEIGNDNVNFNGTITMAKTSNPNSATSEFFINVGNSTKLYESFDTTYTTFGQVIGGMDVVMTISQVNVQLNPQMNNENSKPTNPVTVVKAIVLP